MKTPEEIALIGGGILLSSGLVFGLKSGAASELPNVKRSVGTVLQGSNDSAPSSTDNSSTSQESAQQQQADKFNDGFKQAQQKGWQTGDWGSAKFYVDDNENMHVGSGRLSSSFSKVVNDQQIKTISLDGKAQAPQDSSHLFSDNSGDDITPLTQINGLPNLDTSQTTNMYEIFNDDSSLSNLDLSYFNTSNVTNMDEMFYDDTSLSNLDLSHFDTHNVTNMNFMFEDDTSLSNLDLSHFDTSNVNGMEEMFYGANVQQLTLGSNTKLQNNPNNSSYDVALNATYQNNGQTLILDGNAHPGTWYKQ